MPSTALAWLDSELLVAFMLAGLVVAFPSLEYAGKMIKSAMAFFAAVGHLTVLAVPASAGPDNDA